MKRRYFNNSCYYIIIFILFVRGGCFAEIVADSAQLSADINRDHHVDFTDFNDLASRWHLYDPQVDLSEDGYIDISDLLVLSEQWTIDTPGEGQSGFVFNYRDLDPDRFPPAGWSGITWRDPGGWTTIDVTKHGLQPNRATLDASVWLEWIIANVSPNTRRKLYFPAGNYYFKTRCDISVGDIWIDGAGSDQTMFLCQWAPDASSKEGQLYIRSSNSYTDYNLADDIYRGDNLITLQASQGLSAGDFILIFRDGITWNWPMYGQMVRILDKSGNILTVDKKCGINFPVSRGTIVRKMNLLKNIKLSNIYMEQTSTDQTGLYALEAERIFNAEVNNLVTRNFSRRHISFSHSRDIIVRDNDLRGAAGVVKGDGDYGYGIEFWSVSFGMVANNYSEDLRHHLCIQAANHCVFAYNIANPGYIDYCDLNDHGRGGHNNLWEGNYGKEIMFDSYHDATGLHHTYYRNFATYRLGGQEDITDPAYTETRYNILANVCPQNGLITNGSGNYIGANVVNGSTSWAALSATDDLPPSLYTEIKPSYLSDSKWPLYGPCAIKIERKDLTDMNLVGYSISDDEDIVTVSSGGFAKAAATFIDTSGTYDIHVKYGDEPDGESTFRVYLGNNLVDEWVASEYTGPEWIDWRIHVIPDIQVNQNTEIRIESCKSRGENGRIKWVEVVPFSFGVERVDAVNMDLYQYSDDVTCISASSSNFAHASGVFKGELGSYDINVNYGDEPDGTSTFRIIVNDVLVDQWIADQYKGPEWIDWRTHVLKNIHMDSGTQIRVESNVNAGERGRIQWIEISN